MKLKITTRTVKERQFHFKLMQCCLLINAIISEKPVQIRVCLAMSHHSSGTSNILQSTDFKRKMLSKMLLKQKIAVIESHASKNILAYTFLMPICICYRQKVMMDLYLCFSCYSIYMQGRQQGWSEQPAQSRSRENTWLWLRVPL